jgi:hypothetical protein
MAPLRMTVAGGLLTLGDETAFKIFFYRPQHTALFSRCAWWCGREVVWRLACFRAALT